MLILERSFSSRANSRHRTAAIEVNRVVRLDILGRRLRDAALFRGGDGSLVVKQRFIQAASRADSPAVNPPHFTQLFELAQIAPDGRGRHAELLRELFHAHHAILAENASELLPAVLAPNPWTSELCIAKTARAR